MTRTTASTKRVSARIARVNNAILLLVLSLAGPPATLPSLGKEPREPIVDQPLRPMEAAESMRVPEGFHVTLFAGEPDVRQPIGFCIDHRGRLWVAEAYNYPHHGTTPGDRIVILEDSDGDGGHDKRIIFHEGLNYVTGIEVGFGGAWVMSPPYFYFIPDRDGDDRPDGEPEVLLDGFGNHANAHNLANGLAWGPDGWLYGTHGRTNWSMIGTPGTPDEQRIRFDGGVYRYHPVRRVWESFADGTTNPWGIDWNDVGDAFICNCVNPHVYHVIQGAHYEPWRNRDSSRFAYQRIPSIADHLHFVGRGNIRAGLNSPEEDAAGGGHAHCGSLIYLGDSWPRSYRNTFFTNNIHGRRINNDILRRSGSGYVASHGRDLMRAGDPWFTGVTLQCGPDGSVFVSDWSDTGECHYVENTHRETGRIFKISYGDPRTVRTDVAAMNDLELAELHLHENDWFARHARRALQERMASGQDVSEAAIRLMSIYENDRDIPRKLRAFWTLHALGRLDEEFLLAQLNDGNESIRAWSIRFLCEPGSPSTNVLARLAAIANNDDPSYVRLALASALQRLDFADRWVIAKGLLDHAEDADDANLPLMVWYAVEPLVDVDFERFVSLMGDSRLLLVTQNIARRATSHRESTRGVALVVDGLPQLEEVGRVAALNGILEGLAGRRTAPMPKSWPVAYAALRASHDARVQDLSMRLALVFDDQAALLEQESLAADSSADPRRREAAIESLLRKHPRDLPELLLRWVDDPVIEGIAVRGLGEYNDPQTADKLITAYENLGEAAKRDAVVTLSSRGPWASELLDALEAGRIPRGDLSAFAARQIHGLADEALRERLRSVWGEVRPTSAEMAQQIHDYKALITSESLERADRSAGRRIFQKSCENCHRLFGVGGTIGPDITGSQRTNLDYLLRTLVDPSAEVASQYRLEIVQTTDGRVLTGIVVDETERAITLQTANERLVVPIDEIDEREQSTASMMPEGLLQNLTTEEVRQLIAYLMSTEQVELSGSEIEGHEAH